MGMKIKGRGVSSNRSSRYLDLQTEGVFGGWEAERAESSCKGPGTSIVWENPRKAISRNDSPDVPFDLSVNPYQGCEHGCCYCYARPTHAYSGLSPGLDFETRLFARKGIERLLAKELRHRAYHPAPIALGANTDPYQPVERRLRLTRAVLKVLHDFAHPVMIVTKSALVERDIDLLAPMARRGLAQVTLSVTTLDPKLARRLEPRAPTPHRRLAALHALSTQGIPTAVMCAPVIPGLTDHELESVIESGKGAGASSADYVMLRLPREVNELFKEWLAREVPQRAERVMNLIRDVRGGRENSSLFGDRMRGTGPYADIVEQRFRLVCRRLGLSQNPPPLDCSLFKAPQGSGEAGIQKDLFEN